MKCDNNSSLPLQQLNLCVLKQANTAGDITALLVLQNWQAKEEAHWISEQDHAEGLNLSAFEAADRRWSDQDVGVFS